MGLGRLTEAGEQDAAAAALAGYALRVAEQAAAGLETGSGELAAARWLDAEDATERQALALGDGARPRISRCGWPLRWRRGGSCAAGWPAVTRCCAEAAGHAAAEDRWCAAQFWLGC